MKKQTFALATALAFAALSGFAQELEPFVPKTYEAPSALLDLVDWFAGNRVVQIGSLTSVIVSVVSLLKALAPVIGARLGGKAAYVMVAVVALLGAVGAAVEDGQLTGGEFSVLATAALAVALAPFGYRIVFSQRARHEGSVEAAKTMFRKS